jgi:hypothetical protein
LADCHPHVLPADGAVIVAADHLEWWREKLGFLVALHLWEVERAVKPPHHPVESTGGELRCLEHPN